jgi:hypothetical protein
MAVTLERKRGPTMKKSSQEIAGDCNAFFKSYILGDASRDLVGIRRQRPIEAIEITDEPQGNQDEPRYKRELPGQHPTPEIDGIEVEVGEDGENKEEGVLFDFIPLEYAIATVDPPDSSTIRIKIVFCINYPLDERLAHLMKPEEYEDYKARGKRIVVFPQDSRFHIWVCQCLDILYHYLGEDAESVQFEVEITFDRFENLQEENLVYPD